MSDFELITITFSFILGLGIAQILGAASLAVRNRGRRPLHWLPLAFAASIFLFHIQYWFVLFDYDAHVIDSWSWATYGPFLALAVVLFLSGGIVLPHAGTEAGASLSEDFDASGKLSLLFLVAYILAWVPANAWGNGNWVNAGVWFNLALSLPLLVCYFARRAPLRNLAAIVFFVGQAVGLLFVWSAPADLG